MKLSDLSIVGRTPPNTRIIVTLDDDLFGKLAIYAEEGERSGFVRLASRVLLALTGDGSLESAADHLALSCNSLDDVDELSSRLVELAKALDNLLNEC